MNMRLGPHPQFLQCRSKKKTIFWNAKTSACAGWGLDFSLANHGRVYCLQLANPCLLTLYHLLWCILKEPGPIKHYASIHIAHIEHGDKLFSLQFLTIYALLLCTGTCLLLSVLMFCADVYMCYYPYK